MEASTSTRREWSAAVVGLFSETDECILPLLERAILKEVASTVAEAQLWREETLMVDLVGEFVRASSLKALARLAPLVKEISKEAKKKEDLDGEAMARWLVGWAEKMFRAVLDVLTDSPRLLKAVVRLLYTAARERFPDFEFRAVGALVGLRCYCPAIVSPELYGLVKPGKELSLAARKALVKIAKLLQNVFNETGLEDDTSIHELHQNFIRMCVPKFHSAVFAIVECLDSEIHGSGNLPGSPSQADDSSAGLGGIAKTLGRKSIFNKKRNNKPAGNGGDAEQQPSEVSPRSGSLDHSYASPLAQTDSNLQLPVTPGTAGVRLSVVRSADDLGRGGDNASGFIFPGARQQTRFALATLSPRFESSPSLSPGSSVSGSDGEDDDEDHSSNSSNGESGSGEESGSGGAGGNTTTRSLFQKLSRSTGEESGLLMGKRPSLRPTLIASEPEPARAFSSDALLPLVPVSASVLARWSTKELVEYLLKAGFSEETRTAVKKAKVTGEILLKSDSNTLQSVGVTKLGERKRLLKFIREAGECTSPSSSINNNIYAFLERMEMSEWTAEEVSRWASVNGLEEYQSLLLSRGVTGGQLLRMDHTQLSELGIAKWGHRQRILRLVDELRVFVASPRIKNHTLAWTPSDVASWLKTIEMDQYLPLFARIDGAALLQLTEPELVHMGVNSLGHRKRLLRNVATLQGDQMA